MLFLRFLILFWNNPNWQDGDEGEIIIETEEYEESEIFVENGLLIETIPMDHHHHNQNILVDATVEEGIVEEDGIKYETQLVSLWPAESSLW